jgi:serine/threonine protein phosphatase 1
MHRTFVIGDIHGAYRALRQCLERSSFDFEHDHLICLGDVADGWPETRAVIDKLLKVKNLVHTLGNHDFWTLEWMETGIMEDLWLEQGGKATVESYNHQAPAGHVRYLKRAVPYYQLGQKLFVHAGIDPKLPLEKQSRHTLLWDRNFARIAYDLYTKEISGKLTSFEEVYIGHTPIPFSNPIQSCEVWFMDTGAGWEGVLSMMDVDTKEIFASDPVPSLYPGIMGRRRR